MSAANTRRRLLIRASAIRAANPCTPRWKAYLAADFGPVHPLAALLLPRPFTTDHEAKADFLWVLKRVRACPVMIDLWQRIERAYRDAMRRERPGNTYVQRYRITMWSANLDFPRRWDRIARDVIRRMERGERA